MNKTVRRIFKFIGVGLVPTTTILHARWISYVADIPWNDMKCGAMIAVVMLTATAAIVASISEGWDSGL